MSLRNVLVGAGVEGEIHPVRSNLKLGDMMHMKAKPLASIALIAGLAVIASPLFAHHGDAAYSSTPLILKGCVVKEFNWMNPHSLIKFDYKNDKGELQHWTMEIGSPPSMTL